MNFGSWFPIKYIPAPRPTKYEQEIIIDWLEIEVDPAAPIRMLLLNELNGWRNREVFYYVRYEMPDWTVGACR
jgi:hypothetical protein